MTGSLRNYQSEKEMGQKIQEDSSLQAGGMRLGAKNQEENVLYGARLAILSL
jgi:hypothetical protein